MRIINSYADEYNVQTWIDGKYSLFFTAINSYIESLFSLWTLDQQQKDGPTWTYYGGQEATESCEETCGDCDICFSSTLIDVDGEEVQFKEGGFFPWIWEYYCFAYMYVELTDYNPAGGFAKREDGIVHATSKFTRASI